MSPTDSPTPSSSPARRDPATGLIIGLTYHYTPEGLIDWRRMVSPFHLYVTDEKRAQVLLEQGAASIDDIDMSKVRDKWLRITIAGINQIAQIRGYRKLTYPHFVVQEGRAAACCEMEFIGNVETNMETLICSALASASMRSVDKDYTPYLETFAENRSFARCVKRALQINITSDIEIGGVGRAAGEVESNEDSSPNADKQVGFEPYEQLEKVCKSKKPSPIAFEKLRDGALKYANELKSDPNEWTGFNSIQPVDVWVLIGKIKEAKVTVMPVAKTKS